MNYTYIVKCSDGTLYTGWTNNLEKRIENHNRGTGAKYTKSRLPVKLVYYEEFETKEQAMSREWQIKRMPRTKKLKLIKDCKGDKAMSELFDILNEKGEKTGIQKERDAVHRDGDYHGSVHIWIYRNEKILLQKRKENKESFPGYYDAAATGHVDAGESFDEAAVRELFEEMNIKAEKDDFIHCFDMIEHVDQEFLGRKFVSNEYCRVYVLKGNVDLSELSYQEDEIGGILWIEFDRLMKEITPKTHCMTCDELLRLKPFFEKSEIAD